MSDPAALLAVGRTPVGVLKGRRLLAAVALAWALTVACVALLSFLFIGLLARGILLLSPILWLLPLWLLPKTQGRAPYIAPLLLVAVPVVLVTSTLTMIDAEAKALIHRHRAGDQTMLTRADESRSPYVRDQGGRYRDSMAVFKEGLRMSVGGGALATLLEILGLYCWTRRMPAQPWSIALLLVLFGPAVAAATYIIAGGGMSGLTA